VIPSLSFIKRLKLWWKKFTLTWKFAFAHHPLCERFSDQVFKIGDLYICQGCSLALLGFIISLFLGIFISLGIDVIWWYVIVCGLTLPSFILLFVSFPRTVKRIVRFLFGFGIGGGLGTVFTVSKWSQRIILSAIVLLIYILFRIFYKKTKSPENVCEGCPEYRQREVCSGYKQQMEVELEYSKYATNLLAPELEAYVKRKIAYQPIATNNIDKTMDDENVKFDH
jgi:hypothetical protein